MNIKLPRNTVIMLGNRKKTTTLQAQPHKRKRANLKFKNERGTQETDGGQGSRLNDEPGLSMMTNPPGQVNQTQASRSSV
jgi:hypothetical protein